jgi:hypothetical protein
MLCASSATESVQLSGPDPKSGAKLFAHVMYTVSKNVQDYLQTRALGITVCSGIFLREFQMHKGVSKNKVTNILILGT